MKKRALIYVFYDPDGIVDRYVIYALNSLRELCEYILVVCNGKLSVEGRELLEKAADDVLCRKNIGLDAIAHKEGLEHIGWDKLYEYDELVMMNDTTFGPFYPLSEMFDEMETRDVDYWSAHKFFEDKNRTKLWGHDVLPYDHMLDHAVSNFRVIRYSMLHSFEFRSYWDNFPKVIDYKDAVLYFEVYFNKIFKEAGFTYDTYMSDYTRYSCTSPTTNEMLHLVVKERMPFIRRRGWADSYEWPFYIGNGEEPSEVLEYLKKHTDYDISMIYEHILRRSDQNTLQERLQLNLIMPEKYRLSEKKSEAKIAVIAYIGYETSIESCCKYFASFSEDTDFYLAAADETVKEKILDSITDIYSIKKYHITVIEKIGEHLPSLLISGKDAVLSGQYDYICFMHDKKIKQENRKMQENFVLRSYRSMFGTKSVVDNIIYTFDDRPEIGMISPMPAYHGDYFPYIIGGKNENYKLLEELAKKFGIVHTDLNTSAGIPGIAFWFRASAMKKIFEKNWDYTDFSETSEEDTEHENEKIMCVIEELFPILVQDSGYFPVYALTDSQARSEVTDLTFLTKQLTGSIFNKIGKKTDFWDVRRWGARRSPTATKSAEKAPVSPDDRKVGNKKIFAPSVYPDYGNGFQDDEIISGRELGKTGFYTGVFKLKSKPSRIRFAPVKDTPCIVRSLAVKNDDSALEQTFSNGIQIKNISYFICSKPQIDYRLTDNTTKPIRIAADIYPLSHSILVSIFSRYIKECDQIKELEKQLTGKDMPEIALNDLNELEDIIEQNTARSVGRQMLFFDNTCDGFKPQNVIMSNENVVDENDLFAMHFELKTTPKRLRFDPANGTGCIVSSLEVISDVGELEYKCTNGFELYGNYVFFTNDPQFNIILPEDKEVRAVDIKAFIVPISGELIYEALNDCKVNTMRFERLKKLLSSN